MSVARGQISVNTHKFVRGQAPGDGTCLFWSVLINLKKPLKEAYNEDLRVHTVNLIRKNEDIHSTILFYTPSCTTIDDYCSAVERGELLAGDPELGAISVIYNTIICLVSVNGQGKVSCWLYGENNSSIRDYICILYDEKFIHYDPLYIVNTEEPGEVRTIFQLNDTGVKELLEKFIQEELKYNGFIRLDGLIPDVINQEASKNDDTATSEKITNLVLEKKSTKGKLDEYETAASSHHAKRQIPIEIADEYYLPVKRTKTSEAANEPISRSSQSDMRPSTIEQLLQTNLWTDILSRFEEPSTINEHSPVTNNENQEEEKQHEEK